MLEEKRVRLSKHDVAALKFCFSKHFLQRDRLWLFGSRTNLHRKGGDIDLYVETYAETVKDALNRRQAFISELEERIGEQKIDIVLNVLNSHSPLPIYEVALTEGVSIMNKTAEVMKIADIHVKKIQSAMTHLQQFFPITPEKLKSLSETDNAFIEVLINRFGKLQDLIGAKIIDIFLDVKQEIITTMSIIDKIHTLERLDVITDAELWKKMRAARNYIAHDYPDAPVLMTEQLNAVWDFIPKLLEVLEKMKAGITSML